MKKLDGKVVIVTGGAASIGAGISRHLHGQGAKVVIAARSRSKGEAMIEELGENAAFIVTDLKKDDDIARLVMETVSRFGRLDVLVNNACAYGDAGSGTSREVWLDTLNVNVVSNALLGEQARPHLQKSKGAIVNVGSVSGRFPHIGRWAYPVSKAALRHLTKSQAVEYAADGIRVNLAMLGHIWSDPIAQLCSGDREKADRMASPYNLFSRVADPTEVAQVVAFLASREASYITGSEIAVDGGYSALGPEQYRPLTIPE
ncbi:MULTISPECIES: SDR family oxidoreductase [Marinobacterium]|uniref:SDR family oxidoreductase n=1 Tax=Marinobacterium TaxID=48075 RepID=UPI001A8F53D5|nr:SDR family oxidoreductase [Marinobacterium iners]QSR36800.1 short-chain dehydrogenase [Marinobacterium iners]